MSTKQKKDKKDPVELGREMIVQLKEMLHYSEANIEHLAEMSLEFEHAATSPEIDARLNAVLNVQNDLHSQVDTLIDEWELVCNRVENERS